MRQGRDGKGHRPVWARNELGPSLARHNLIDDVGNLPDGCLLLTANIDRRKDRAFHELVQARHAISAVLKTPAGRAVARDADWLAC